MLIEFTTSKYRAWVGLLAFQFWVLGLSIVPLIGYLVPAWRTFLLVTAIVGVPVLFFWWLLPESPRWLLLKGRETEARTILSKAAKWNKRPLPDDLVLQKPAIPENRITFRQLFGTWDIAKKTLISWDLWFVASLVYYGVSYGSIDLGGNRYLNSFLVSIVELPSNFAMVWSAGSIGRKKPVIIGIVIAFIASAISVAIPTNKSSASIGGRVTAAIIAKFFINYSFSGIYLWCVELFPTSMRSTGHATSSAAARLGSFSASYIIWLIRIHAALPYGIMGALCLQAAIFACFLPETKSKPTLETMDDMHKNQGVALSVNDEVKAGKKVKDTDL